MSGNGKTKFVALDSNIFIYSFENNPEFTSSSRKIIDKIDVGNLKATTSVVSIIETLSYPAPREVLERIEHEFTTLQYLRILDVTSEIALVAARIRREYKFRLPDSIQLATALVSKAQVFITNDSRLKQFKELKVILLSEF